MARKRNSDHVDENDLQGLIDDMISDDEEISSQATERLAQLRQNGRLSIDAKRDKLSFRVSNPLSPVIEIALFLVGGTIGALGFVWLLLFGLSFVGLANLTMRCILLFVVLKDLAKKSSQELSHQFAQINTSIEWIMVGGVLVGIITLSAYLILWVM